MNTIIKVALIACSLSVPATAGDSFSERVVGDCPELAGRLADIDRVRILRQWCWSHVDWAPHVEAANAFATKEWRRLPVEQLFASFDRDEGGVICEGTAWCFHRLLEHFGYRSWILCSGKLVPNGWAHAVTLVEVQGTIFLHDSSFDCEFVDSETGQPIAYSELLDRLKDRRHESIRLLCGDWRKAPRLPKMVVARDFVDKSPERYISGSFCLVPGQTTYDVAENGSLVFRSPRLYSTFHEKLVGKLMPECVEAGYPADAVYFYAKPLWVSGKIPLWQMKQ